MKPLTICYPLSRKKLKTTNCDMSRFFRNGKVQQCKKENDEAEYLRMEYEGINRR